MNDSDYNIKDEIILKKIEGLSKLLQVENVIFKNQTTGQNETVLRNIVDLSHEDQAIVRKKLMMYVNRLSIE